MITSFRINAKHTFIHEHKTGQLIGYAPAFAPLPSEAVLSPVLCRQVPAAVFSFRDACSSSKPRKSLLPADYKKQQCGGIYILFYIFLFTKFTMSFADDFFVTILPHKDYHLYSRTVFIHLKSQSYVGNCSSLCSES